VVETAARRPKDKRPDQDEEGRWIEDPYWPMRNFLFDLLRLPGEENEFRVVDRVSSRLHNLPLMPLLCGDNPLDNLLPSKFLRLTDYQLFILKQWAEGKFINEIEQGWLDKKTYNPYLPYPTTPPKTGRELDRGVLSNALAAPSVRAARSAGSCAIPRSIASLIGSRPTGACRISSNRRRRRSSFTLPISHPIPSTSRTRSARTMTTRRACSLAI
jgi:hypothetical protein